MKIDFGIGMKFHVVDSIATVDNLFSAHIYRIEIEDWMMKNIKWKLIKLKWKKKNNNKNVLLWGRNYECLRDKATIVAKEFCNVWLHRK